jgi:hypothetical protein
LATFFSFPAFFRSTRNKKTQDAENVLRFSNSEANAVALNRRTYEKFRRSPSNFDLAIISTPERTGPEPERTEPGRLRKPGRTERKPERRSEPSGNGTS